MQNNTGFPPAKIFLYTALGTSALLAVLYSLGLLFSLHWLYWWFDLVTHILGGFAVTLVILYILWKKKLPIYHIFFLVSILIFLWEFVMFYVLHTPITSLTQYLVDTSIDVVMGYIGLAIGYYFYIRLHLE